MSDEPTIGRILVLILFRTSIFTNQIQLVATGSLLSLVKVLADLPPLLSTPNNLFSITVASSHIADASKNVVAQ